MPLQETSGNATTDAYGGGVAAVPNYIEDVFSTWLYTGNGSTQTITNGIDLSTYGGLVWSKARSSALSNFLCDTVRGRAYYLYSDATVAQQGPSAAGNDITSFNSNGYSLGPNANADINNNADTFASWTFRKQPKFFDVVTWSGDDAANRQISHSLGSVPGCIIVKRTNASATWRVWHQNMVSNPANLYQYQLNLNTTDAVNLTYGEVWGTSNNVTSTTFQVGSLAAVNGSGGTYVAYVFAHNAGGFGLTGTDNVISCGSYTGNGSFPNTITLGYEPQWVMIKKATSPSGINTGWVMFDNMRGMGVVSTAISPFLYANTSDAESSSYSIGVTATGFQVSTQNIVNTSGDTYIYIAIRRGPMKVPTDATKVYETGTQLSTSPSFVSGFPVDFAMRKYTGISDGWNQVTRLQGTATLSSDSTAAETTGVTPFTFDYQTGWSTINSADSGIRSWMMRRAPSFMDVVCYTGTGSATTFNHNLGVTPELMIVKRRSTSGNNWAVYSSFLTATNRVFLNTTAATSAQTSIWNDTEPTSSVFTVGTNDTTNASGSTYVAYLFATCAGVSKVGSYTGNGTTQTINCGFGAGGVRFVIIKRTDSTGGWYLYDTARGMTVLTDPYLFLNTADAESATLGSVTTVSTGFAVNASILAAINTNAASYIFLAIA